ncbi:hypothetical protein [Sorangium sp. So ce1000]|uniref:hypothetical protein n=1 Tax=Sorangium sp. So ce1000 TaxID=3133325 RepID=UPI003F6229F8
MTTRLLRDVPSTLQTFAEFLGWKVKQEPKKNGNQVATASTVKSLQSSQLRKMPYVLGIHQNLSPSQLARKVSEQSIFGRLRILQEFQSSIERQLLRRWARRLDVSRVAFVCRLPSRLLGCNTGKRGAHVLRAKMGNEKTECVLKKSRLGKLQRRGLPPLRHALETTLRNSPPSSRVPEPSAGRGFNDRP